MKICKMCGKEGVGIAIRDHIEANHLDGIALPCERSSSRDAGFENTVAVINR